MEVPQVLRRIWALINVASVLAWLLSLGIGGLLSSILANFIGLAQPWRSFFFASVLLIGTALTLPLARVGLQWLGASLPAPASSEPVSPTIRQASEADREWAQRRAAADERRREQHASLRRAVLAIEADLRRISRHIQIALEERRFWSYAALDYSSWLDHRGLLGEHQLTENAYRLVSVADDEIERADEAARSRAREYQTTPQGDVYLEEGDDIPLKGALGAINSAQAELSEVLTRLAEEDLS